MAERDDCIADILKGIKDRRDRKYVNEHLEELDARAEFYEGSYREQLGRAAEEMLKEQAVQSAVRRRNVQMDALKFRDLRTFVDHAASIEKGSYQLGIEARLVGVNRQFFDPKSRAGNQQSAAAIGLGAQKDWIGGAVLDMERAGRDDPKLAGLDRLFYSKAIEDQIFLERYELTLGAQGPPRARPTTRRRWRSRKSSKSGTASASTRSMPRARGSPITRATSPRRFTIRTACAKPPAPASAKASRKPTGRPGS